MNIRLLGIGKTTTSYIQEGISEYSKRLGFYCRFVQEYFPPVKNASSLPESELKKREGELLLRALSTGDRVILLDEKGAEHSSTQFAASLQKEMNAGTKRIVFIVGGAFGFSDELYSLADKKLSLSKMTLTHEMVRLVFVEQLYRAFTIIKGEKYHHS